MDRTPAHRVRRACAATVAAVAVGAGLVLSGGCGGDDGASPATSAQAPVTLPDRLDPTTSTTAPGPSSVEAHGGSAPATAEGSAAIAVDAFAVEAPTTCDPPSYEATITWDAAGAVGATVLVDGVQVAASVPVDGPFVVPLPCDGAGHAVALVLVGADGSSVIRTRAVLATPGG
jgi:hypothetical protein